MRKLLTILLFIPVFCIAQVPETNWEILFSADKYIGQQVGTGSCQDLRDSVLMNTNLGIPDSAAMGYYHFVLNDKDTVFPGDFIILKDVVVGSSLFEHHIAIVYATIGYKSYFIIHQNVGVDNLEDSKVVVTRLDLSTVEDGLVEFHRVISF